ncbi:hypothetical protein HNQ35_001605 [Cerasibacillus quisquiliarum]|uniref:sporulation YhaL family protein n=1 Tax=Cerasibacillus quisquiliarum TaxID=227865 RepID=UPI0011BF82F0|nr:sporulation YhaL family protein [Cerasibacillus quisquiliarum]MBB5146403.1 hypothetical protein [Cerasibacillus quisquiliarum]
MFFGVPWWVILLIAFTFLSGYMALRAMVAEKRLEERFIEQEGQVYMKRIEEERKKRFIKKVGE